MWNKDHTATGALIGALAPAVVLTIVYLVVYSVTKLFSILPFVSLNSLVLLSIAPNFLLVRYFFLRKKQEQTSKGCLVITVGYIILFFIFIHGKQLYHLPGMMW